MPRAQVGTPKYLANAMKAKGLQRLRWYCQICEKQCRDDNGFKCHIATESHLRQALAVGESAGKHISDYSTQFQHEFVTLLSRRFATNRVKANNVYQEYIQDRHHLHMNATRWLSLTEFIKHLGRSGIVRVEETEKGLFISWIDNSPKALAKAEANQKKERATTSDEQRERMLISEQIQRANAQAGGQHDDEDDDDGNSSGEAKPIVGLLQREEGAGPLRLAFGSSADPKRDSSSPQAEAGPSMPPPASTSTISPSFPPVALETPLPTTPPSGSSAISPDSSTLKPQSAMKFNALKKSSANAVPVKTAPLKTNVFKLAKSTKPSSEAGSLSVGQKRGRDEMPAAQRLILEEEERKKRRLANAV